MFVLIQVSDYDGETSVTLVGTYDDVADARKAMREEWEYALKEELDYASNLKHELLKERSECHDWDAWIGRATAPVTTFMLLHETLNTTAQAYHE